METSGSVFSGVVRLTAVIRRDRPDSTLLAENHRECDRQKKNQWMGTKGKFIQWCRQLLLCSIQFFNLLINLETSRKSSKIHFIFNITVVTVNHHLVFKLYSDRLYVQSQRLLLDCFTSLDVDKETRQFNSLKVFNKILFEFII